MVKLRVFELARELNIPGKDLIQRLKEMGYPVKGNFDALAEDQIVQIKAKMLEPVTRVESAVPSSEETETGAKPRKRRIISAKRSEEVHKIQESLGISGPLPEDEKTREEVEPQIEPAPAPLAEEPVAADQPEEVPPAEPPAEAVEPVPVAAEPVESAKPEEKGIAAADIAPIPAKLGPAAARAMEMKKEAEQRGPVADPEKGRDLKKDGKRTGEGVPAVWKEFKRAERKRPGYEAEAWSRPHHRRRPQRRGPKPAKIAAQDATPIPVRKRKIRLGQSITVSELAGAIGVKAGEIIKSLMALGIMANTNQTIEGPTVELIASEFDVDVEVDTTDLEDLIKEEEVDAKDLRPRPPIVTVMGHVDHGKTSLLDKIRKSRVTESEAGGITQHIGAYYVSSQAGDIVFLDTPGHEAFTSLRARGANITDVVVLVVAADDGVMPQTVEAIEHAQVAKVPILVAVNKIDRPNAEPEKIKRQLMDYNLLSEELGGETIFVNVSAKSGEGIDHLLEMIRLQAEVLELKAIPTGHARGFVIESRMDRRRGPIATVIVQRGKLEVGNDIVAGATGGRVRAMFNDKGESIQEALPSTPVEILGYAELPQAGELFVVTEDEKTARQIASARSEKLKVTDTIQRRHMHLEDFLQGIEEGQESTLNVVLKTDTQGSLEAVRASLEKLANQLVKVNHVRAGIGGITETDISLAATTNAVVIGFNVRPDSKAQALGASEGMEIKCYTVIYDLISDVKDALQGLLKPIVREEVIGHCEVREVFSTPKDGQIVGGYVTDGRLQRNSFIRLFRDDVLIHSGVIGSLRRFKEDVQDVQTGYECGVRVPNFKNIREGDLIEAFVKVEETPKLDDVAPSQPSRSLTQQSQSSGNIG